MFGRRKYQAEGRRTFQVEGPLAAGRASVEPTIGDYLHDIYSHLEEHTELLRAIRDAIEADK